MTIHLAHKGAVTLCEYQQMNVWEFSHEDSPHASEMKT